MWAPWFIRSDIYPHGISAGVFTSTSTYGTAYSWASFRVVSNYVFKKMK